MAIPKTFQLGGRTWKVRRNIKAKKWFGKTYHSKCEIWLSTANQDDEEELHTFLHEVLHAIAGTMGWEKFNKDEAKIDAMAGLLLQVTLTSSD